MCCVGVLILILLLIAIGVWLITIKLTKPDWDTAKRRWKIDAVAGLLYSPPMAKKISGAKTSNAVGTDRRAVHAGASPLLASGSSEPPAQPGKARAGTAQRAVPTKPAKSSTLLDTRVVYCGDNLEQLAKLPDACVDLIYIDPPFNSNRNYDGGQSGSDFWGETKEKRAFEDRHENTKAYIDYMRPRCVQLARVLKKTGSFYYHCDDHASHYVKGMLDQIFKLKNQIPFAINNQL